MERNMKDWLLLMLEQEIYQLILILMNLLSQQQILIKMN